MKFKSYSLALLVGAMFLQGCGGGDLVSNPDKDQNPLNPAPGVEDVTARPRPSATALTITTDASTIYDAAKQPLLLRGVDMQLGTNVPATRIAGIKAIKDTDSNVIRLYINEETSDPNLEAALIKVVEQGLVAIVTLDSEKLRCSANTTALNSAVDNLWLKKWLGVIAQDRFQPHLIINIANAWGPEGIFNADSYGYQDYLEAYKAMINKFRTAGFKVPIAIDAPCGQDFNAFARERGRELLVADKADNLILSVHADGARWNTSARVTTAISNLMETGVPFVISSFKGSGVDGLAGVDHLDIMQKGAGNAALELNLPWLTTADSAAYVATFPEVIPLLDGAGVSANLYLDARYLEFQPISDADGRLVPKGKLSFAMYVKDEAGNTLRAGIVEAKDLRGYQWNRVAFTLPKSNAEIDAANLLNGSTSFDLSKVKKVGIELLANGKASTVKAPIKLDDLEIYPGAPEPTLAVESKAAGGAWTNAGWGGTSTPVIADGYMKISLATGDWAAVVQSPGWQSQEVLPTINFKQNVFVDIRVFVPASYAGEVPQIKMFGNFGSSWEITAEAGASIVGELQYDAWNTFRATLKWSETYDVSIPQNIGFQVSGVSYHVEPLLFDTFTITQQPGKRTKTVTALQYESKFSKGVEAYEASWGRVSKVEMIDGELNITPAWTNPNGKYDESDVVVLKSDINSISDIDVSGPIIYKVRIFVPASYAGSDLKFRIFTQDNNWGHDTDFPGRELTIADFKPGEWTTFEFTTDTFTDGFARTQKLRNFGFRWDGVRGNTDTVKIDDIQLYGNTEVEDTQPLYTNGFDTQAAIDSVVFDFASGAFTGSALVSAKTKSWKIAPFGWMAYSWFGNAGEEAVLNISNAEDIVDLTPRGEEIVNSEFGVVETSLPANFK